MKLSTQADYAVRAVYELARHDPGVVLHTGDIAAAQHIPGPRLAKVIHDLARADLVHTQRGHQGGVMLARPPAEITVRDVYEAVAAAKAAGAGRGALELPPARFLAAGVAVDEVYEAVHRDNLLWAWDEV